MKDFTLRRTSLYIPGNNPGMLVNAAVFGADSVIFDLEDAIPLAEKDSARILVRNALRSLRYPGVEITVRVNSLSTPFGRADFEEIVPLAPSALRLPKCETADNLREADDLISELEMRSGIAAGRVKIIPIIETALGGSNLLEISRSCERIVALNYGAEDYTADLGAVRTREGRELDDIRARTVMAARIAGVQALDSVFTDVNDSEGLFAEVVRIRGLGFDGKSVIHPRQVSVVHRAFTPSDREISFAQRVLKAMEEAALKNSGVLSLDGRMVDAPVVAKARKILALAEAARGGKKEGTHHEE